LCCKRVTRRVFANILVVHRQAGEGKWAHFSERMSRRLAEGAGWTGCRDARKRTKGSSPTP
jgi:hypothetical protein